MANVAAPETTKDIVSRLRKLSAEALKSEGMPESELTQVLDRLCPIIADAIECRPFADTLVIDQTTLAALTLAATAYKQLPSIHPLRMQYGSKPARYLNFAAKEMVTGRIRDNYAP